MEKQLKDYFNYYLPVDIEYMGEIYTVIGFVPSTSSVRVFHLHGFFLAKWEDINIRLRPLSDITEEERVTAYRVKAPSPSFERNALVTQYLLSRHFDLFGLIESDLAIDATKLPVNQ